MESDKSLSSGEIFPYVKRFSDEDSEYEQPNFLTGIKEGDKEESRIICERLLTHLGREKKDNDDYAMKDKVFFGSVTGSE